MCLLIFAFQADPRYPLVLAANRDEFYARATAPADFWPEYPHLLAGRDLEQGGTWMGITRDGRFAAITNYRDPARTAPAPRSRGELPLDFLLGGQTPERYLQGLQPRAGEYAGFNLLVGNAEQLWYLTNSLPPETRTPQRLLPGLYGLSNARLNTPWPKVELGKQRLAALLHDAIPEHDSLAAVVMDRQLAHLHRLRQQGLDGEMDQLLSAQFITAGSYGTRSCTTLWLDGDGLLQWRETSFNPQGEATGQSVQRFSLEG
jgi:uncharacterized protein with NRDE domain